MAVKGKVPPSKVLAKPGQHEINKAAPTKEERSSDDDHIDEDMDSEESEGEELDSGDEELESGDEEVESGDEEDESEEFDDDDVTTDEEMPAMGTKKDNTPAKKALAASKPTSGKAPGKAETPKTPAKFVALGERDKRSVFLKHVKHQTTEAQIVTFFESVGKVIKIRLVRSKSFAIVQFDNQDAVEKALALSRSNLNGKDVVIERCQSTVEKRKLKNRKQKMRRKEKEEKSVETPSPSTKKTKPTSGDKQQPKGQQKKKANSVKQQGSPTVKSPLKKETKQVKKGNAAQGTKGQPQAKGQPHTKGQPQAKGQPQTKGQPSVAKNKKSPNAKKGSNQRNTK